MSRRTASKLLSGIQIGGQIFEHNIKRLYLIRLRSNAGYENKRN